MKHGLCSFQNMIIISLALFLSPFSNAQDSMWTRTFGGTNIDVAYAVEETNDEGYIIAGYTRSYGTASGRNLWLFKTDKAGNLLWNQTFGGNSDDEAAAVKQTPDGGFIAAGYTASSGSGKDVYIVKTDSGGNHIWSRTYGGTSDEEAYAVEVLPDGGYIVGCATSSFGAGSRDGWLIRLDASGNSLWTKTLGGLSTDGIRGLQRTSDNCFIITGWTASDGAGILGNAWLVKTDSLGNILFNKNFGGSDADRGLSVQQTSDGGYILTGYTASTGAGLDDLYLIRTDASGNQLWIKTFGGTGRDYGNAVKQTADGGFLVAGYTLSYGAGGDDLWLVKTDSAGTLLWQKTYGGTASDVAYSMDLTSDGGYVVVGHTLSSGAGVHDAWLLRTVTQIIPVELVSFTAYRTGGRVILNWTTASEVNNSGFEIQRSTDKTDFTSIGFVPGKGTATEHQSYSCSDHNAAQGINYYRLKQIDYSGSFEYSGVIEVAPTNIGTFELKQNFPNPFNPSTVINFSLPATSLVSLKIFDASGNEVALLVNEVKPEGNYQVVFNAASLPSGVYFCKLQAGVFFETKKLLLIK
ncbi:MAG: T9SS type A sorting domain-containing protein [Ignavibacteriaceae bacterium]|nr:T9SS type A sorting domain-containing protein [Ignavibacteriaceae bacterium]